MSYNLIFIDESGSMQRAVSAIFYNSSDFNLNLANEPSSLFKMAETLKPDIIVLSYNTIDIDLKKSIAEIKANPKFSDIPLILLVPSDLSDNERETLIKLKADGFIYRPFDKDAFIAKIRKALNAGNPAAAPLEKPYKTEDAEEEVFDISVFEVKNANDKNTVNAEYENPKEQAVMESSELSQAFENLFKDDAIFKEFQNINKSSKPGKETEQPEQTVQSEQAGQAGGTELPGQAELPQPNGPPEPFEQFKHMETKEQQEPSEAEYVEISETSQEYAETSMSGEKEPAEIWTFDNKEKEAAAGPASKEYIEQDNLDKNLEKEETVLSALETAAPVTVKHMENFAFNETFSETINAEKSKGELNLKILDEQNLVKLDNFLKESVEKTFEEIKPQIIETIKNIIPEIIEKLVKEEIEKIKRQ